MQCIVSSLVGDGDNSELLGELEASPENRIGAQNDVGAEEDDPNNQSLDWVRTKFYFEPYWLLVAPSF